MVDPSLRAAGGISGAKASLALRHSVERNPITRSTCQHKGKLHKQETAGMRLESQIC